MAAGARARAQSRLAGGLPARSGVPDRRCLTPGERPEAGRNPDQALDHTLVALEKTVGEESAGPLLTLGQRRNRLVEEVEHQGDHGPFPQLHLGLHAHAGPELVEREAGGN